MLYAVFRLLLRICFKLFGRMKVYGRENMPPKGRLIVVANHRSYNDPPVLAISLPRLLDFLAKIELFHNPISRFVMRQGRGHPINRFSPSLSQVQNLRKLLREDRCLVVFPEGTRSTGGLLEAELGAAFLAQATKTPILPVAIFDTRKWPLWRLFFPFKSCTVRIGKTITVAEQAGKSVQEITNLLMHAIAELLPPELRGAYAVQS